MEKDFISILLAGHGGYNFQDVCERFLIVKHGREFVPITTNGREGDGGRDGYCLHTGEYFAVSSKKNVAAKLREDFVSCMAHGYLVSRFTYITNRGIRPKDSDVLDDLKRTYPEIEIGILRHTEIAVEMAGMSSDQIEYILGQPIPFGKKEPLYFKVMLRKGSFTLWQSIKDSMHLYLVMVVSSIVCAGILLYLAKEWVQMIAFLLLFGMMLLYMHYNKENLRKYKYAHQILYLMAAGKLNVGAEVLLDQEISLTIKRESTWNFTINRRVAACRHTGCNGDVQLYKSDMDTFIGRCDKDKVNHTYQVDNNFYENGR